MEFRLSGSLVAALRDRRRQQRIEWDERGVDFHDETEEKQDAFLLDPGMGPIAYLTADGRVLLDERSWFGDSVREATDDEAIAALVVGARKTGIVALLELIPVQPSHGVQCPACTGSRWMSMAGGSTGFGVACFLCHGRGWADQPMLDDAAANGTWPPREQ